eukprot:365005-Chlamydomonas_euryale.AAC.2
MAGGQLRGTRARGSLNHWRRCGLTPQSIRTGSSTPKSGYSAGEAECGSRPALNTLLLCAWLVRTPCRTPCRCALLHPMGCSSACPRLGFGQGDPLGEG